jgi:hypothetical protein
MNDTLVVLLILGGTFLLALAVDRGIPNMLESAAYMVEDFAAAFVVCLRQAAGKMRQRHAHIEADNRRRQTRTRSYSALEVVGNGEFSGR